jgi:hypothetical protein
MNPTRRHVLPATLSFLTLAAAASAQGSDLLFTLSQTEQTLSGSGGTVLQTLRPNEIVHLEVSAGCAPLSAEKWSPRSCMQTMAGDENGDGLYFNPTMFGRIDALCAPLSMSPVGNGVNPRTVFWSPSAAMGTTISGTPFRPGDVGRIVQNGIGPGQVEYFMRREQFNQALGLPLGTPIDVDAIAWSPNHGVFFSLDADIVAPTACGPVLVQDGAIVGVPPWAITWTPDFRVAAVLPNSAVVVYNEPQVDLMVANAAVTDRFGACIPNAIDLESLEIDWSSPGSTVVPCAGFVFAVPDFVFSTETMTGASLLTTVGGGTIWNTMCSATGRGCGGGPTFGFDLGLMPPSTTMGVASHVNALALTWTCRHVLEAQQHVVNVFPFGAPAGATSIDYGTPFPFNLSLIELVPPTVPWSVPAFPFSLLCFPDLYAPSLIVDTWPLFGPWGSYPLIAIPPLWSGKILYQNIGFGGSGFELSTPVVIDVQ